MQTAPLLSMPVGEGLVRRVMEVREDDLLLRVTVLISTGWGSLTLMIMSAFFQISSAERSIRAPAARYSASADPAAEARALLDENRVSLLGEYLRADREQGDSMFVLLDFLWNTDDHAIHLC